MSRKPPTMRRFDGPTPVAPLLAANDTNVSLRRRRSPKSGALGQAFEAGRLGTDLAAEILFQTGIQYGRQFEAISGLRTAERHEVPGTIGGSAQENAVQARQTLDIMRRGQSAAHLQVLDLVCGEDHTIHIVAREKLGRDHHIVARQLREALIAATENLTRANPIALAA